MKEDTKELICAFAKLGKELFILLLRMIELAGVIIGFVIMTKSIFK